MTRKLLTGAAVASALTVAGILPAPAQALTINGGSVIFGAGDIGQTFVVDFDGNVETQNVPGLSSRAAFTIQNFTTFGSGSNTRTEATLNVLLENNSSGGITSRTSALGFDTDPNLVGVGNPGGSGNTRIASGGIFTNDRAGAFPNQFGSIEFCATNGTTCQGGTNGGVFTGQSGSFTPILAFAGIQNQVTLSNFGVRYQDITGTSLGTSGTGRGTPVPTPALLPGLIGLGVAAVRKAKAEQSA